jgi:transcriptional regulator with XRE-family HTH domain
MAQQARQFGQELRRLRLERGLTLTALAALVHYSKSQLSKVERGIQAPGRSLARLCDAALQARGTLIALAPQHYEAGGEAGGDGEGTAAKTTDEEEVWVMHVAQDGRSWFGPMSRRQMMAAGAASAVAAVGLPVTVGTRSPVATGPGSLLEVSRSLFEEFRRLGQSAGPAVLLPALVSQTNLLCERSAHADVGTRQAMLLLASRYAEYVGWLVQESGDERGALAWTQRAVDLARGGGDLDLAAYGLVRRALVALYRDDARQVIDLAQGAQGSALPPRIRGLAAQREAQGHALAGDFDACMRCLERAREQLARHQQHQDPVMGTTNLPDPAEMVTGWCLFDLGRPAQAAAVLDRQLTLVAPEALRTRVRYGARQALAHAANGEIEHACDLVAPLLDTAAALGSATIAVDLRQLAHVLARHPHHPKVRALAPALGSLQHTS